MTYGTTYEIYIIYNIYFTANSSVWGSLRLAPIIQTYRHKTVEGLGENKIYLNSQYY